MQEINLLEIHTTILVGWLPPPVNYVKLNIDGSRSPNNSIVMGGLIRDHLGH